MHRLKIWQQALGPGLMFAAAAIGVSHLIQSTRAGALYGLAMLPMVLLANVLKYPAFRFGPHYAVATGQSLLEGYRRQGAWALGLYAVVTLGTMSAVLAAVTAVTAALVLGIFGLSWSLVGTSAGLIALCAALLGAGGFRALDATIKALMGLLTLATVAATVLVVARTGWSGAQWWLPDQAWNAQTAAFTVALVGWMPSAVDVAVWQSLWTVERARDSGHRPTLAQAMGDFHLGYGATTFLALCFVVLGAALMHGTGEAFAKAPGDFARQIVDLYVASLGEWSRALISVGALATMFSTVLTVCDGFPRALAGLWQVARSRDLAEAGSGGNARRAYWAGYLLTTLAALGLLSATFGSLPQFVDLATTMSFVTAPVLAWLNHRAVCAAEVPEALRPGAGLRAFSWLSIVFLGGFALWFLWVRFAPGV